MPWAKVDDGWWCHPKVLDLSLAARGLWITALSWSCLQRKDVVPESFLRVAGASKDEAKELLDVCLWEPDEAGYRIHDWHKYQEMSLGEKRAEAGRKGGQRSKPKQTPKQDPIPTHPNPTQPSSSQDNSQPDDDFDWKQVWTLIAEWKRRQQSASVGAKWVLTTARNQPLDRHPDGMSFAERGRTFLEFWDIDEPTMAELLTGRRRGDTLKRRTAA